MDQIAHFCPEWWFKHFTAAYRGSPPPAVFQNKYQKRNMKEIQQGNLLVLSCLSIHMKDGNEFKSFDTAIHNTFLLQVIR